MLAARAADRGEALAPCALPRAGLRLPLARRWSRSQRSSSCEAVCLISHRDFFFLSKEQIWIFDLQIMSFSLTRHTKDQ